MGLLSALNAFAQCLTPSANDTSRCGSGSVVLSASSTKDLLLWYDAPISGNFVGLGENILSPSISNTDSFYVSAYDTSKSNTALNFDGSDDYVAIDNFSYTSSGLTELTVEAWILTNSVGDNIIASYDRSEFWRFEVNGDAAGPGQIGIGILTSSGILDFGGTTSINDSSWHHVAAVFDNGTVNLYVDGALDATTTTGATFGNNVTRFGFVGTGSEATTFNGTNSPTDYFNGAIDEVRIWNVARTQAQIQASMDFCLDGT